MDFAYAIHINWHRCIGAKVGGRIVPFTYQLQMGDQIEIITQKTPESKPGLGNPNLGFCIYRRKHAKNSELNLKTRSR